MGEPVNIIYLHLFLSAFYGQGHSIYMAEWTDGQLSELQIFQDQGFQAYLGNPDLSEFFTLGRLKM